MKRLLVHTQKHLEGLTSDCVALQVDLVAGGFAAGFQDGAQSLGAKLNRPSGIAVHGNIIYVSEIGSLIIRKIDVTSSDAVLSRFAGIVGIAGYKDGNRLDAMFNTPQGLAVSPAGDKLYVADSINNNVRQVDMATNLVSTLAGGDLLGGNTDGLGTIAK
jgi:DNA-binding beta-propeller fold protein YncE